ncbi:hypothetical protein RIF29_30440 [Crotalaria pallida]|uniref:Alpha 1,4-glycosyltransferase domain-containing protein n=1 Tax=Crotalaria pallida TaxID=3830 RepID=A0AAN9HX06_CROPI
MWILNLDIHLCPNQTLITQRRTSKLREMFDHYRVLQPSKISILYLIIFSAIIFLIHYDGALYHDDVANKSAPQVVLLQAQSQRSGEGLSSSITLERTPLLSMQEKKVGEEVDNNENNHRVLVVPINASEEERIAWFQGSLKEFKILNSNNLTRQFHSRVMKFFSHECEAQFFMTWINQATSFGSRELLSVESVFKVHPKACLVILSTSLDSIHGYRILKPLVDQGFKVQAVSPDLPFLFKGTKAETWFNLLREGKKDPGEIPLTQNLSNLIRLAVLYKYGGVYLDTDFIVIKPFTGLRNCIGAQSIDWGSKQWTRLNNAVLVFDVHHPLLLRFINEFALTFDGNKWGHNGPYLVSRVIKKLGKKPGFNFTILPPMAFYPADWNKIGGLLRKPKTRGESKWVDAKILQLSGETYGVHLWNKQSSGLMIEEGSVMEKLISNHCVICNYL